MNTADSIRYTKDGEVVHKASNIQIGSWRKEDDPVYAEGRFRVWTTEQTPEEGMTCFPRYNGAKHFRDVVAALEGVDLDEDLDM